MIQCCTVHTSNLLVENEGCEPYDCSGAHDYEFSGWV